MASNMTSVLMNSKFYAFKLGPPYKLHSWIVSLLSILTGYPKEASILAYLKLNSSLFLSLLSNFSYISNLHFIVETLSQSAVYGFGNLQ